MIGRSLVPVLSPTIQEPVSFVSTQIHPGGRILRDDVAAVLDLLLHDTPASRRILYLNGGQEAIAPALERFSASPPG